MIGECAGVKAFKVQQVPKYVVISIPKPVASDGHMISITFCSLDRFRFFLLLGFITTACYLRRVQSNPPIPQLLGLVKNQRYWESCRTNKNLIWDLKMSGGIEGEAVNGGAVLGGTTVVCKPGFQSLYTTGITEPIPGYININIPFWTL